LIVIELEHEEVKVAELYREIPLVVLEGTPRQRGRIYGETRKTGILSLIEQWKTYLEISNGMDSETFIEQFLEETSLLKAVKRWTPELLDEVEGIAESTGVDFKVIFALQMPDEEWWYQREKNGLGSSGIGSIVDHCSSVGISGQVGIPNFIAQNMDLPGYYDGHQVLLRIVDHENNHESLVFSVDGMIALAGLNNHGIGICCNVLEQLNHSKDGLPVAFVHRGVLSRSRIDDAIDFIYHIKHASGQNYIIGDPKQVIGLECSANKVVRQLPDRKNPILCHTNHPLVNNDVILGSNPGNSIVEPDPEGALSDTEIRLNTLAGKFNSCSKPVGVEEIKSILSSHDPSDHPICRHKTPDTDSMTLGSIIMELTASPTLYLSSSPPCSTNLFAYRF
jgi:predicted choloylglycine hydrolase